MIGRFASVALLASLTACAGRHSEAPHTGAAPRGHVRLPVAFSYETLDGRRIDSAQHRGSVAAVLFVTTYDLASQVEAQRLDEVLAVHPDMKGLLVVLEEAEYATLAVAFRDSLRLSLPVAMADEGTLEGRSSFGAIERVPTLVVLDPAGREAARRPGLLSHQEIEKALATASGSAIGGGPAQEVRE